MTLQLIGHGFGYEAECLVRLFYPGELIQVTAGEHSPDGDVITAGMREEAGNYTLWAAVQIGEHSLEKVDFYRPDNPANLLWETERRICVLLYHLLCQVTGQRPPWGILTGVRPVRLCRKLLGELGGREAVEDALTRHYHALPQKAKLAMDTLEAQREILADNTPESYSLYVGIPFCPSRCLYCSFVSHAIDKAAKLVPDYLRLLCRELEVFGELAKELGLALRTVYIGGGTPTTLEPEQLRTLLGQIEKSFPISEVLEYTVEAGRPDAISREKLAVLQDFGVSRISINPQTMDDTILAAIGRNHTAQDIRDAVALAREMGFDNINMDLIAGLPGQTPQSFSDTLAEVIAMGAQNITVHTLTVKRSSTLRTRPDAFDKGPWELSQLLELAQENLAQGGYHPYYLYRQQGTRQNLENTGFALKRREGLYNVFSMEDAHTIFAAGAGAVTKLCARPESGEVIKRVFNYKYPYEYISGFEELLRRKEEIRRFYRQHVLEEEF